VIQNDGLRIAFQFRAVSESRAVITNYIRLAGLRTLLEAWDISMAKKNRRVPKMPPAAAADALAPIKVEETPANAVSGALKWLDTPPFGVFTA
jgi:hypothetical protein